MDMPEGESKKDSWIWEKVACEELGLRSLENRDGGRKEGVPCAIRILCLLRASGEGTAQLSAGGLGPTWWGAFWL